MSLLTDIKNNLMGLVTGEEQKKEVVAISESNILVASKPKMDVKDKLWQLHYMGLTNEEIADSLNDLGYKQFNGRKISRRYVKLNLAEMKQNRQLNLKQRFRNRNTLLAILKIKGIR